MLCGHVILARTNVREHSNSIRGDPGDVTASSVEERC